MSQRVGLLEKITKSLFIIIGTHSTSGNGFRGEQSVLTLGVFRALWSGSFLRSTPRVARLSHAAAAEGFRREPSWRFPEASAFIETNVQLWECPFNPVAEARECFGRMERMRGSMVRCVRFGPHSVDSGSRPK